MACETVVSCDLCDAVGTYNNPNFQRVKISFGDNERTTNNDILCATCAAPLIAIMDALRLRQERSAANLKLSERVGAWVSSYGPLPSSKKRRR